MAFLGIRAFDFSDVIAHQDRADRKKASTDLYIALCNENLEDAQEALSRRLGIDPKSKFPEKPRGMKEDKSGKFENMTLFHIAAIKGNKLIMEELRNRFPEMLTLTDKHGYTALHHNIMRKDEAPSKDENTFNSYDTILWLLDNGFELDAPSNKGHTVLDIFTAFLSPKFDEEGHLGRVQQLLSLAGARSNQPVDVNTFEFPEFPEEVQGFELYTFPAEGISRAASTDSMPQTLETGGPYNPDAYDVSIPDSREETESIASSRRLPRSRKVSNFHNLWEEPEDDFDVDDLDIESIEDTKSVITNITGYSGFQVIPSQQGSHYNISSAPSRAATEADWISRPGSRSPSPPITDTQDCFSTPGRTLPTPATSLNTRPSFFGTVRTPTPTQNVVPPQKPIPQDPSLAIITAYPTPPGEDPFVTPNTKRAQPQGKIPKNDSNQSQRSDTTSLYAEDYCDKSQTMPILGLR